MLIVQGAVQFCRHFSEAENENDRRLNVTARPASLNIKTNSNRTKLRAAELFSC